MPPFRVMTTLSRRQFQAHIRAYCSPSASRHQPAFHRSRTRLRRVSHRPAMPPKNKSKKFLAAQKAREQASLKKAAAGGGKPKPENARRRKTLDDVASTVTKSSAGSIRGELGDAAADNSTTATGNLESIYGARDIKIGAFSLNFHNKVLVEDTLIELTVGRRYGLIGANGCGKSTFLRVLAERQVPIPDYIDIHLLAEEAQPTEETALEYVINSAKAEVSRIEAQTDDILTEEGPQSLVLQDLYERLDELDPSTFESRASTILCGLGFNSQTIQKKTKDMSGGWRMRVALAKALFIQPSMLLLDEPTNHVCLSSHTRLSLARWHTILISSY